MKLTIERRKYALHRMSAALDRVIRVASEEEKEQANKWVKAWQHYLASIQVPTSGTFAHTAPMHAMACSSREAV